MCICSYSASNVRFSELSLAVDSFTKQNLTIEYLISHSPSMEDSNTDGKLKKYE